ncbi:MAG: response regulator [Gemmatimonadetes bacterium]|nr:response regulator [Gemmatimonadota bacterium]
MSQPLRVLHLEDNTTDAALVEEALRAEGYAPQVQRVETREAFLDALEGGEYDLILSDYSLPTFDGMRALELAHDRVAETPFLLVTGTIGEEKAAHALRNGATDFVLKHRLERLGSAVRRALAEVHERRQRRHVEEMLRVQGDLLRKVVDTAPNLIFVNDRNGKFTLVNQGFAGICGRPINDILGKGLAELGWSEADAARALAENREVMDTGRPRVLVEQPITDPTTRNVRWFLTTKVPLLGSNGIAHHVLGVATEVTDRRQLEAQLRQAQRLEAVGRLTGGVAHDFNNLLTAVLGTTELLLLDLVPNDPRRMDVEEIRDAARRGAALTRQLLAFSRQQVLQPRVLDLNSLLRNLETLLRRMTREDVELVLTLDPRLARVKADPGQLEQVVANLVVNARDAIGKDGHIAIRTSNAVIGVETPTRTGTIEPGQYVRLEVADTGAGMDEATMSQVFEPFFTTKPEGKGTGLGLSTVYGIVKQSGGHIHIDSELGRGTTFTLHLPVATEPEGAGRKERGRRATPPHGTETVLVVEDEPAIRRAVKQRLEQKGYVVLEASDGVEALRVAEAQLDVIRLLICDHGIPGVSGTEVVRRLTARRPALKVLHISGQVEEVVEAARGNPNAAELPKPFTLDELIAKVRELLDQDSPATGKGKREQGKVRR